MTTSATRVLAATEAVAELSHAGLPALELLRRVAGRVRSVVPYAGAGWLLTDPATMLHTAAFAEDVPGDVQPRLIDNELVADDFAKFSEIARSATRARRLSDATGGRPERSSRYRELYAPAGYGDELRVAFCVDGACWAVGCLARSAGDPAFSTGEASFMARLSEPVASGVRAALRVEACTNSHADSDGPGMLVVDADDVLESMTGQAERWLREMSPVGLELPSVIYEVARLARAGQSPFLARARVRVNSGRWLIVHGAVLQGPAPPRAAIILEPARSAQLAPLIVELYGLTEREQEVTRLLASGLAIDEIGRSLFISRHTVRDHVKAIFGKLGVTSRPELTAKLFYEHFLPELRTAVPASSVD